LYDFTFSSLPKQQGQLYQFCDIKDDKIKQLLLSPESLTGECNVSFTQKKTGWLTKEAYENIRAIVKQIYFKLKMKS